MDNTKIEAAYNDTFSGLRMFYRDCELNDDLISKYYKGQILIEKGLTDVSSFARGLSKNFRYVIASNKAIDMGQMNPDVSKFGFHIISGPSIFKILDIYKIENQTQIFLLHFNINYLDVFHAIDSNIEEQIVSKERESFDKKIQMNPSEVLNEEEWIERTSSPIGMSNNGDLFII